jgi:hypothetical protein
MKTINRVMRTKVKVSCKESPSLKITEGIAVAQKKGVKFGRPSIEFPKQWGVYYIKWKEGDITAVKFMGILGLMKATFYRKVKEYEVLKSQS